MPAPSGTHDEGDVGVARAEEYAQRHPSLVTFARVGWIAKGTVYALTGVLSILVGLHAARGSTDADTEASQTGAIARIAESSAGIVVLVVVAAGLIVYSLWRLVTVALPGDNDVKGWMTRFGYLISAVTSLALAWTSLRFARQPNQPDDAQDGKVQTFTTELMSRSFGRAAVIVIGVILIVIAATFVWRAVTASFTTQLLPGAVGPISHQTLVVLGRIGWIGRAGMMALIGFFLVRAAVRFDPDDAQGLDGSLRKAASSGLGTALVIAVGVGLLAYGVFCALSAPKRRLVGARS